MSAPDLKKLKVFYSWQSNLSLQINLDIDTLTEKAGANYNACYEEIKKSSGKNNMHDYLKEKMSQLRLSLVNTDEEPPSVLYHYSDAMGVLGLFESQTMWATHTLFLNDTTEINYTHELVETLTKELLDKVS